MNGLTGLVRRVDFDAPLAPHTTMRVGGPARAIAIVEDARELAALMAYLAGLSIPFKVLGKGANLLVAESGFDGVVIILGSGFAWLTPLEGPIVRVGAGLSMAALSWRLARLGISGFEFAAQIPGTVGGGLVNNAGAFAQDFTGLVRSVAVIDADGLERTYNPDQIALAYRHSAFKGTSGRCLVAATLEGRPGNPEEITARIEDYGRRRAASQPVHESSAGCIFKNPPQDRAGRLIEVAGLKGARVGEAAVSTMHANFIVNRGSASASHVWDLIRLIKDTVRDRTGVSLDTEVELVGRF